MNMKSSHFTLTFLLILVLLFVLLTSSPLADCTRSDATTTEESDLSKTNKPDDNDNDDDGPLKYKFRVIGTILVVNLIGLCVPIIAKTVLGFSPESKPYSMTKAFAAGVIISISFTIVLPDAYQNLEPYRWKSIFVHMSSPSRISDGTEAMAYAMLLLITNTFDLWEMGMTGSLFTIVAQLCYSGFFGFEAFLRFVLEPSSVHSVIIGISIGVSVNLDNMKPMLVALTLHQYCEAVNVGQVFLQRNEIQDDMVMILMMLAPAGIGIGIVIASLFEEKTETATWIFDLFAAKLLNARFIMVMVVPLRTVITIDRAFLQSAATILILVGVGCMSILAIWA